MILYTLHNHLLRMDIYEDKVVFTPKMVRTLTSKQWNQNYTLAYQDIEELHLEKKFWPRSHQLHFRTRHRSVIFSFRNLIPFYERLHLYLVKQVTKHRAGRPHASERLKTVTDILRERKQERNQAA